MAGDSGPEAGAKGAGEGIKGKAKEVVGALTGNDGMADEGRAQQDKADAQRDVAVKEAESSACASGVSFAHASNPCGAARTTSSVTSAPAASSRRA